MLFISTAERTARPIPRWLVALSAPMLMIRTLVLALVGAVATAFGAIRQSWGKKRSRAQYQAESALHAAEERHRVILESFGEGVISTDANGGVELLNTVAQSLTGWSQEEARGKPVREIFHLLHEESGERIEDPLGFAACNGAGAADHAMPADHVVLVARDGQERSITTSSTPIRDGAGRSLGVVLVFRDVTRELWIRSERETSLGLLRLLNEQNLTHELVQNITALLQAWTGCEAVGVRLSRDGDYPYFETRGFPASFVEGERFLCERDVSGGLVLDENGEPVLECMCGNVLRGRFDPERPFFTKKGSFCSNGTSALLAGTTEKDRMARTRNRCNRDGYESVALIPLRHGETTLGLLQLNDKRPDRFSPDLIAFLENAADQIAIALAQRQAQAARQQLALAIEQAAEAIVVTDPAGAIQYVNPAFEAITGYASAEVIGHNPRILKSGRQGADFYKELWDTISSGNTWKGHFVNKKKDGTLYTEDASISAVRGPAGTIVNYVAVKRDVTRERQLEEQLRQAQKMESIGRLAGGVAHDFNNMLQVITGYTEISLARVEPDSVIHRNLAQIGSAARRSADLVGQLLVFARKQTVNPRVLDVNEAVAGTLKMLQRLIGENIELTWTPGHNAGRIVMDPSQLDQVLANLAVNARDAINGVGTLSISTSCDPSRRDVVILTVSDTGCGMSRETLSHLFEPFFTTKAVGKGTGLGLATIYGIVSQNNGTITVESEPGRGTTFRIALPKVDAVPEPTRSPQQASNEPPHGSETVLVVEDETAILEIALSILKSLGYKALGAATPEDALRLAAEHEGAIDLVLTDIVMPQMNGRDLALRLGKGNPGLRTLYMSGYTADVIAHKHLLKPGTSFISKPFTPDDLARKIREVLG